MITIYDENGVRVRDVFAYEVNSADMGESTISCETSFEELSDWHVIYNGEVYRLGVRKPSGKKDTNSFDTKFSLVFHSSRDYLKNFTFMNFVDYGTGNPQPSTHTFSLAGCTLPQFISIFNLNLNHYLPGKWRMELSNDYHNTGEQKTLSFERVSLWNVLIDTYQNWGARWTIKPVVEDEETIMVITIGADPVTLDTTLEYGKDNGLVNIERNNPQEQIVSRLRGYGASKNIPTTYFHEGDPDANNITQGIFYNRLLPKSYRDYIRGYNSGESSESETWAYNQGVQDAAEHRPMKPIDFVCSENEEENGISYGAIEDNESIYPTFQGATRNGIRIDDVLKVEQVDVDSPDDEKEAVFTKFNDDITGQRIGRDTSISVGGRRGGIKSILGYNNRHVITLNPTSFTLAKAYNTVKTNLSMVLTHFQDSYAANRGYSGPANPTAISIPDSEKFVVTTTVVLKKGGVTVDTQTFNQHNFLDLQWEDLAAGTYSLEVSIVWYASEDADTDGLKDTLEYYLYNMKVAQFNSAAEKKPFKETFDIWVRNIWNTTKGDNETPEDYTFRVWSELATIEEMVVQFSDGLLAGEDYDFRVAGFTTGDDLRSAIVAAIKWCDPEDEDYVEGSHWKLSLQKSDAEYAASGKYLPNRVINAIPGDHFFFLNIEMPYDPYVYDAEAELEAYLDEQLALFDREFPNFTIQPSSVFCGTFAEVDKLVPGNKIAVRNLVLVGEDAQSFYIQSVALRYQENALWPEWSLVITDEVTVNGNAISVLEGKVNDLTRLSQGNRASTKAISGALASQFLFKNGQPDVSISPTTFNKEVKLGAELVDKIFRRGDMAGQGQGFGVYTDSDGNRVVETDILVARLALRATEVIINQVTYTGGKQVFSAAGMVVSAVEEIATGWRCFFDTKEGTVQNHFMVGDGAFCQRFGGTEDTDKAAIGFKTYWCRVTAIGADHIDISSTDKMAGGTGTPSVGDNIAQLGNNTNTSRQAALIIDETHDGGGLMTWLDDIDGFTLTNKDSINIGRIDGKTWAQIYGNLYVGKRGDNPSSFLKWFNDKLVVKGVISQSPSGDQFPIVCWRNPIEYDDETTYYFGDGVTHNGSSWLHIGEDETTGVEPSLSVPDVWTVIAAKGEDATSEYVLNLTNDSASINCDSDGHILPEAIRPTCTAKLYYGSVEVSGATYSITTPSSQQATGVSIDANTGVLTFGSNFSFEGTSLEITVRATSGSAGGTAIMTVTKSYPGIDGQPAVSYWLVLSADTIKVNPNVSNPVPVPSTITATAMKQVGSSAPEAATDCNILYGYDTQSPSNPYTGAISVDFNHDYLSFILKKGTEIVDGVEIVPILWDGSNGQSTFKSIVFRRSNSDLSGEPPQGGSYEHPIPANWSDGVPDGEAQLWMSTRIFTNDGRSPQQSSWTTPRKATDTADIDFEWSAVETNPGNPTDNPTNWHNTATSSDIWMAVRKCQNGVWGAWQILKVKGESGGDGRGVSRIREFYKASTSKTTAPTGTWTEGTVPAYYSSIIPYLWNYEVVEFTTGQPQSTTPSLIATWGKDGKGISSITEYYQAHVNGTTAPTGTWTEGTTPSDFGVDNPYLWNKEKIVYTDGSTTWTNPVVIGYWSKGRGISTVTEYYCASASQTSAPSSGWSTSIPSDYGIEKPFLWNKETITYTEGDPSTTTPVVIGVYGRDGKSLTGITEYYLATSQQSGVTRSTAGWTTSIQTIDEINKYLWNYERLAWNDNGVTSYTYTNPVIIGTFGTRGNTGATGPTVRGPREYIDGRRYCSGEYNGNPEDTKWIDLVVYNNSIYRCNTSHTPTIWIARYWTPASDMEFVATKVLYAVGAIIENAVIRKLLTNDSGSRIEADDDHLSMYDESGEEKLKISGENIDSSGFSRTYNVSSASDGDRWLQGQAGSGHDSKTLVTFVVTGSGTTQVTIPSIEYIGHDEQGGDGGSLILDSALVLKRGTSVIDTLWSINDAIYPPTVTIQARTYNLSPGTYTLQMSWQYQGYAEDYETSGDPRGTFYAWDFYTEALGQVVVSGGGDQMVQIGANGIVINLGGSFSAIFTYENGSPRIILQGKDSGGNIVGLKVDATGAQYKNGSGDWSLITSGSSGGGVTGNNLTSDSIILGGGNSTIRSSSKYIATSWQSGSATYLPVCGAIETYIKNTLGLKSVSFSPTLTSGTELGRLTIGDQTYILYCNQGGASGDYLPIIGGTLTGDLRLKDSTNYGRAIFFGNGSYAYLKEVADDLLEMYARAGIRLKTSSQSQSVRVVYGLTVGADANNNGTYMLHVTGKGYATEWVDASDERLKNIKRVLNYSLDDLRTIPKVIYTWKDDAEKREHIGTIAQGLLDKFPQLVTMDEQTQMYGVNYDSLGVLALHGIDKLAEENMILKAKVENLEHRVERLEEMINELLKNR